MIDNYNNYPDKILHLCNGLAETMLDSEEQYNPPHLYQAVYDVLSTQMFEQYMAEGEIDVFIYESEEKMMSNITQVIIQHDLLQMKQIGLLDTLDDGETFFLTSKGKDRAREMGLGPENDK